VPPSSSAGGKRIVLDLLQELTDLLGRLAERDVEYALCGGLAMAVYGVPRATVDIDLLVPEESLAAASAVGASCGFDVPAQVMRLAGGAVEIHRLAKIDPDSGDTIPLDLVVVTPELEDVWQGRRELEWQAGKLWVVSRDGLAAMKRLRGSGQDHDDIARLTE
jgi:hypothetical protein